MKKAIIQFCGKLGKINCLLLIALFLSTFILLNFEMKYISENSEISEEQYRILYIECQQNVPMKEKVLKYFDDQVITQKEYKNIIKGIRLSSKQVLIHTLND